VTKSLRRSSLRRTVAATAVLGGLLGAVWTAEATPPGGDVRGLTNNLKRATAAQDRAAVQSALEEMIEHGGPEAAEEVIKLLPRLQGVSDEIYWQLISGAAGFRDRPGLTQVGEDIVRNKRQGFARDLVFGLENNTSPYVVYALKEVLEDGSYDMQIMAADQFSRVRTVDCVDIIINFLDDQGDNVAPEIEARLLTSLRAVTGEAMGDKLNWIGWWQANRGNGLPDHSEDSNTGGHLASSTLDANRNREFESLSRNGNRILVISSIVPDDYATASLQGRDLNYDHMSQILTQMDIEHTVVSKAEFEEDPEQYLNEAWTILVNCSNIQSFCACEECGRLLREARQRGDDIGGTTNRLYGCPPACSVHEQVSFRMTRETIMKIKEWVEAGGSLFTEDWGIVEVVEVAWPGEVTSQKTASANGQQEATVLVREATVAITPGRGMTSHPLMRGVFARPRPPANQDDQDEIDAEGGTRVRDMGDDNPAAPPSFEWKIDDESPSIHVTGREVTVLMESDELAQIASGDEAVAVTFRAGNGQPWRRDWGDDEVQRPVTGGGSSGRGGGSRRGSRTRGGSGEWAERVPGGRVLHVMSHFGKQQASRRDTFVLQNLILNFIMESNRNHMNDEER
jgi:hypothetical protein